MGSTLPIVLYDDDGLKTIEIRNKKISSDAEWVKEISNLEKDSQTEGNGGILSGSDQTYSYTLPTDGGYYEYAIIVTDITWSSVSSLASSPLGIKITLPNPVRCVILNTERHLAV